MPIETIELTGSGATGIPIGNPHSMMATNLPTRVCLGRIKPQAQPACLMLSSYLADMDASTFPTSTNWRAKAGASLSRAYKNNQWGCCVFSGKAHNIGLWSANDSDSGGEVQATDAEIEKQYFAYTGGRDNGANIAEVLDIMRSRGFTAGGKAYKIDGYVSVDWTKKDVVKAAILLFGAMSIGFDLPGAWKDSDTWDVSNAGRTVGGHDVSCLTGDTKIPLLNGSEYSIKELMEGIAGDKFWVYSCDDKGNIVPGLAHSARKTGTRNLVKVTLDNEETIRCTPDHLFMLRDGEYKEAGKLQPGDSLMPLYRKIGGTKKMDGYEMVFSPSIKQWRYTHRTIMAAIHGGRYEGDVVHHKDFNKLNNAPDNLELMTWEDHTRLHAEFPILLNEYAQSEEGRAKSRELMTKLWADPEWRAKMVIQCGKNGSVACKKKAEKGENGTQNWTKEQFEAAHKKMAVTNKGRKLPPESHIKRSKTWKEKLETDIDTYEKMMARVYKMAEKRKREGVSEEVREKMRNNMKKAHEALAKIIAARPPKEVKLKYSPEESGARGGRASAEKVWKDGLTETQKQARMMNALKMTYNRCLKDKFPSFEDYLASREEVSVNNHKVVSVQQDGYEDVYDLTVDTHHNFAISAGVFVHNCVDYDAEYVYVSSWGRVYRMTWAAFQSRKWISECYAMLAPLWYNGDNIAPSGLKVDQLKADLVKIGNGIIPDTNPPLPVDPVAANCVRVQSPIGAGSYDGGRIVFGSNMGVGEYELILKGDGPPPPAPPQ